MGICGELGADTALTETFLRMGVDELSMNAKSVLPVRKIIRSIDLSKLPINKALCAENAAPGRNFPAGGLCIPEKFYRNTSKP